MVFGLLVNTDIPEYMLIEINEDGKTVLFDTEKEAKEYGKKNCNFGFEVITV